MKNSFLDFLNSMTIAMEADDITNQTATDLRNTLGETPTTQTDTTENNDGEDLGKVDDIFGIEENKRKTETQNNNTNNPDTTEEIPDNNDTEDTPNGNEDTDPNTTGDDTQDDINTEEEDPDIDLAFTSKNRVRDNLAQLYTIIAGDIEIIVNSLTDINDSSTINVMNSVLNHLRNSKDYIYKTLTKELKNLSYDELLQRYITLKRVYDMCIMMMEKHLDMHKKDKK